MPTITPFLTFASRLEEAIALYASTFKNAKITGMSRAGPGPDAPLISAEFELEGQRFIGLNGGPSFAFADGISLFVRCETQDEVDHFWDRLTANGGTPGRCGWLKDPFGVSWQIIPDALGRLMGDPDPAKAQAVMQAMLKMNKLIIAELRAAHAGA